MAILVDKNTTVIIQGITGSQGSLHARYMLEYGVNLVGGVTPGKGGSQIHGVPVFNTVNEALENSAVDATLILVPPLAVKESAAEAIENGIQIVVIITEYVPVQDSIYIKQLAKERNVRVIGPNTIGLISPGKTKVGIMPGFLYSEGKVGIVSRSGTLTHEMASTLSLRGIGQSTCVGIGGDPVPGIGFLDVLKLFEKDNETEVIILIGEIGGISEEEVARYITSNGYSKPVIAFIAGQTAPAEKKMGHAGAIILGESGSAQFKYKALSEAGIRVAKTFEEVVRQVQEIAEKASNIGCY
ncbi:MAG: succinate--CoA ligase subunit alpha [Desulfitobacteriaceae bacterium]